MDEVRAEFEAPPQIDLLDKEDRAELNRDWQILQEYLAEDWRTFYHLSQDRKQASYGVRNLANEKAVLCLAFVGVLHWEADRICEIFDLLETVNEKMLETEFFEYNHLATEGDGKLIFIIKKLNSAIRTLAFESEKAWSVASVTCWLLVKTGQLCYDQHLLRCVFPDVSPRCLKHEAIMATRLVEYLVARCERNEPNAATKGFMSLLYEKVVTRIKRINADVDRWGPWVFELLPRLLNLRLELLQQYEQAILLLQLLCSVEYRVVMEDLALRKLHNNDYVESLRRAGPHLVVLLWKRAIEAVAKLTKQLPNHDKQQIQQLVSDVFDGAGRSG